MFKKLFNSSPQAEQQVETFVYCTLQVEGLHKWPDCPLTEVDYLKYPHRHVFHIKAYSKVQHDDRDQEFIVLKHKIENYLSSRYYDTNLELHKFGSLSCEMIARELLKQFDLYTVEVSEDNENGAIVTTPSVVLVR